MGPELIITGNLRLPLEDVQSQADKLAKEVLRVVEHLDRRVSGELLDDAEWNAALNVGRKVSDFANRCFILQRNIPIGADWFDLDLLDRDAWREIEDDLKKAYFCLVDIINFRAAKEPGVSETTNRKFTSRKIFIVHGHDEAMREAVARVLSRFQVEPIILHEQPNMGATLIEKFERHADVGFALILLTPDDEGRTKGDKKLSQRARQNVILELGYFIGKLGRERVMVLRKGDIEIPSDIIGVVYEPLDGGGAWRFKLGKELQAAGYDVDLNKL